MIIRAFAIACIALAAAPLAVADPAQPRRETITPVMREAIPNIPGKTLSSIVVSYAPGAKSLSHRHGASTFIYAYVLSGAIRSQVNDGPVKVYKAGQYWVEPPGAHHQMSENASATEPAKLLVVILADTDEPALITPDKP